MVGGYRLNCRRRWLDYQPASKQLPSIDSDFRPTLNHLLRFLSLFFHRLTRCNRFCVEWRRSCWSDLHRRQSSERNPHLQPRTVLPREGNYNKSHKPRPRSDVVVRVPLQCIRNCAEVVQQRPVTAYKGHPTHTHTPPGRARCSSLKANEEGGGKQLKSKPSLCYNKNKQGSKVTRLVSDWNWTGLDLGGRVSGLEIALAY